MSYRSLIGMAVALLLLSGTAQSAQWMVPAGAHAIGAEDTNWRTDLRLVNGSDAEVTVTVYLLKAKQNNSALDMSAQYTIPAGGQVVVGDVFWEEWAFDGTGALLIDCDSEELVVTSRTYNLLSDGRTYGQFVPGVPVADALQPGEEGHIIYLAKSDIFRSNLGFAATTAQGGTVTVMLYDEFGAHVGTKNQNFLPYDHRQIFDIFAAAGAAPSTAARAEITTDAPVVAYGSIADIGTGDPVAVMAERAEVLAKTAATELAITAVAHAPGAESSLWRTDIRIYNPGDETAMVVLAYHEKNTSQPSRPSETFTIGAGQILALDDAMMSGFGYDTANGGLMISSDEPVLAWSRTYNQAPIGISGQSIPAVPVASVAKSGWKRLYTGLNTVEDRSNAGFFNLSDSSIEVDITMKDGSGTVVGEGSYELEAGEMDQINDIFGWLGVNAKNGGYYSLLMEGVGDLASYVSIANRLSNDPVYEAGVEASTGGGGGGGGGGGAVCVDVALPAANTVVNYDANGNAAGTQYNATIVSTYISFTTTQSRVRSVTEIPLFGSITLDATADYTISSDPEGWLLTTRYHTVQDSTIPGGPPPHEEFIDSYSPPLNGGPYTKYCEDDTWTQDSVEVTTEEPGVGTDVGMTDVVEGEVVSLNEQPPNVTTTFSAIHKRTEQMGGDDAGRVIDSWIDPATGVIVALEQVDVGGDLLKYYFSSFATK